MEIKELITFFVDKEVNILDVTFRLIDDLDDTIRQCQIDYDLAEEYGYSLTNSYLYFPDNENDLDMEEFDENEVDKNELINFLTEYFTINPDQLPKTQNY
jgi:hypothetical protein